MLDHSSEPKDAIQKYFKNKLESSRAHHAVNMKWFENLLDAIDQNGR